jgi:YcxB-like protein
MNISFTYDKKTVIQALRYHFLTRPEIRVLLIFVNVFAILSAVLYAFKKIQAISFVIFSALWLCLMLVIWRILPATIYKKSQTFLDHFSMNFNESAVTLSNERGSKAWEWQQFSTFLESPYFFHLYFDSRSFFLVPKDAFEGIGELQEVRALLKRKIVKR